MNSPSLDRIDNSKGYVKGNVAVISLKANKLKSDLSLDELRSLARALAQYIAETDSEQRDQAVLREESARPDISTLSHP